jgi:hypothetical protein
MSNIRDVNTDVMSAEEEARASKLKAAHLASTAARQGSDCFETIQMVSKAKFQTEELLRATTGQISDAERHIQESKELTRIMAEKARYHAGKAEDQIGVSSKTMSNDIGQVTKPIESGFSIHTLYRLSMRSPSLSTCHKGGQQTGQTNGIRLN